MQFVLIEIIQYLCYNAFMKNITDYIHFYINYCPCYTDIKKVGGAYICTTKYVDYYDYNLAFVNTESDLTNAGLTDVENYFLKLNRTPALYEVNNRFRDNNDILKNYIAKNYTVKENDIWFVCDDIIKLKERFAGFNNISQITLEKVNKNNVKYYKEFDSLGFSGYPEKLNNYDNYFKGLWEQYNTRLKNSTELYLIKYQNNYAGTIILSVNKNICYLSGFSIIPQYRKTKVLLALVLILNLLIEKKVDTIFCATAKNSYPAKLYKHLGLTKLCAGKVYTKNPAKTEKI